MRHTLLALFILSSVSSTGAPKSKNSLSNSFFFNCLLIPPLSSCNPFIPSPIPSIPPSGLPQSIDHIPSCRYTSLIRDSLYLI